MAGSSGAGVDGVDSVPALLAVDGQEPSWLRLPGRMRIIAFAARRSGETISWWLGSVGVLSGAGGGARLVEAGSTWLY